MFNWAESALTWRFTGSSPTMRSSSASASSSKTGSVGPAGSGPTGGPDLSRPAGSVIEGRGPVGGSGSESFSSRPPLPNSGSIPSGPPRLSPPHLDAEQRLHPVCPLQHVLPEPGERDRREVGGVVVPVALGDRGEPGRG